MPAAFLGTEVVLSQITISSAAGVPTLEVLAQFRDKAGNVHGAIQHRFATQPPPELHTVLQELVALVTQKVAALHFSDVTEASEPTPLIDGIAEALRDDDDLQGEQA